MPNPMSLEHCPHCCFSFDNRKHRHTAGLLSYFTPRWPSEQIDHQFTVRCPQCGEAYVSESVKFLGIATRRTYLALVLVLVLLIVVFDRYGT